jgi:hypothetical protein
VNSSFLQEQFLPLLFGTQHYLLPTFAMNLFPEKITFSKQTLFQDLKGATDQIRLARGGFIGKPIVSTYLAIGF